VSFIDKRHVHFQDLSRCDSLSVKELKEYMREAQRDSAIVKYDIVAGRVGEASTRITISRKR